MSFFTILGTLLIEPLKLIFEIIFMLANRLIYHPGLSIIILSLVMNFLVLPLYRRADAMQEQARDIDAKLREGVAHIKKTFSGDERMMILQAYYQQNHYKPTDALNGSVSLLLEIPFFMAAYQFLSHLELLNGVALGPIADLSAPDGLIRLGSLTLNLLPILMTLINVISSAIYLKGFPLKTKIQLYGMAAFFLVFLYTSPSGLVFYWTLNNLFSLVKTVFYKIKNPKKVLCYLASAVGLGVLAFGLFLYDAPSLIRKLFILGLGFLAQLPLVWMLLPKKFKQFPQLKLPQPNRKLFLLGCVFLTVLVGLLIPSSVIVTSPQEFVEISYYQHPLWYLVSSTALAAGTFLVWLQVFYWLATPTAKSIFDKAIWVLCGIALVNYMAFGTDLGLLNSHLQFENGLNFSKMEMLVNLAVLAVAAVVLLFVVAKWKKAVAGILLTGIIALGCMSGLNMVDISRSIGEMNLQDPSQSKDSPHFTLSKTEENVVVIMLDRAMGLYVPYIFNEKPELQEQFDGFTYYKNTISFGGHTNFGAPALFGGYEYTPVELNKRDNELLKDKHNEALKVLPVLFDKNGFDVTVCDPPYTNYQWITDTSFFDAYPGIQTYATKGMFSSAVSGQQAVENNHRNFFCYSIMKIMPLPAQGLIYNLGMYNQAKGARTTPLYQAMLSNTTSQGISKAFTDGYDVLKNLSSMTEIRQDGAGGFMIMTNDTTHEPSMLQEPNYEPQYIVDNTPYYQNVLERFTLDGKTLNMENALQIIHYQTNMATMIQLGNWFDYLRENGVYDNTRIILVSDHGSQQYQSDDLIVNTGNGGSLSLDYYYPLLMVKDFGSEGFTTSDEFMTNADVPTLAVDSLIEKPVNPFTGKLITNEEKFAHDQFVILSGKYDIKENNGCTFLPSAWAAVGNGIWDTESWTFYNEEVVLPDAARN